MTLTHTDRRMPTIFLALTLLVMVSAHRAFADPPGDQGLQNRRLAWAAWHGDSESAKVALKAGADPSVRFPVWEYTDFRADTPPTPQPQAKYTSDPVLGNGDPFETLVPIIMVAYGDVLKAMIAAGADTEAHTSDNAETPLLFLAANGLGRHEWFGDMEHFAQCPVGRMEDFLKTGANVHARDKDGNTVLHLISQCLNDQSNGRSNYRDVEDGIRLLARHGADVNAKNNTGETVLKTTKLYLEHYSQGGKIVSFLKNLGARDTSSVHPARSRKKSHKKLGGNQ